MNIFESILVFIIGSCVGSFLNVCIYRLPLDMSIVFPFSFCPKCKKSLNWYDNLPLIGYIKLKAKCRFCKEPISFRYFLVELLTALLFLAAFIKSRYCFNYEFVWLIILYSVCIVSSFIDIDYRAIPAYLCVLGILLALLINIIRSVYLFNATLFMHMDFSQIPIVKSFVGIFIGLGFVYFFKLLGDFGLDIYLKLTKKDSIEGEKESLGLGDVDFIGMVGAFLGWQMSILTFFLAPIVSLIYGIYIIINKKSHLIAYLPFLSIAAVIASLWGDKIIRLLFKY